MGITQYSGMNFNGKVCIYSVSSFLLNLLQIILPGVVSYSSEFQNKNL